MLSPHRTMLANFAQNETANVLRGRSGIWRRLKWLAPVALTAICVTVLVSDVARIKHQNTGDFEHFYYAGQAVLRGSDPYQAHTRGYIYPPLVAFMYQPMAKLSFSGAAALMLTVNVAVTLIALALTIAEFLRRQRVRPEKWTVVYLMIPALLANIDKVKGEWQMWQTDVWMLLLFVMALRWVDRLPVVAGLCLGVAINIKYIPIAFLPYFLIRQRWSASLGLVAGIIIFAVLPAVSTGWNANTRNWRTATNGLVQMTGTERASRLFPVPAAEIHGLKDSLSCSITSALARAAGDRTNAGLCAAGFVALALFGVAWLMYYQRGIKMLTSHASFSPAMTGVEWVMLIATVLAFAPQTNTRHLFDALIYTAAATVFLAFAKPRVSRWPLIIGTVIVCLGFILPPGSRTYHGERTFTVLWLRMGGPCICLVIAAFTLLWTALQGEGFDRRLGHKKAAVNEQATSIFLPKKFKAEKW